MSKTKKELRALLNSKSIGVFLVGSDKILLRGSDICKGEILYGLAFRPSEFTNPKLGLVLLGRALSRTISNLLGRS